MRRIDEVLVQRGIRCSERCDGGDTDLVDILGPKRAFGTITKKATGVDERKAAHRERAGRRATDLRLSADLQRKGAHTYLADTHEGRTCA